VVSNSPELKQMLKVNENLEHETILTLGMTWKLKEDQWIINFQYHKEIGTTKRELLSSLAKFFDPSGFISPTKTELPHLFSKSCHQCNPEWDQTLCTGITEKLKDAAQKLRGLYGIEIPRRICLNNEITLFRYSDATPLGYGFCY
jgi:Pao retrotransposon peptidase